MKTEEDLRRFEATEAAGGKARIAIATGNWEAYLAAWEAGREAIDDMSWAGVEWEDVPLEAFLPPQIQGELERNASALRVGDLRGITFADWISWKSTGPKGWATLVRCLREARERHQLVNERVEDVGIEEKATRTEAERAPEAGRLGREDPS